MASGSAVQTERAAASSPGKAAAGLSGPDDPVHPARHLLRRVGIGGEPHRRARRRVPAASSRCRTSQSALVQFAYYGAYFSLAIPAAMINRRFGYKTGVLTGLGLASIGGLLFIPASSAARVRAVPRRALRAGRRAVDPRDLGQPVRDRDGARGERDAAAQPRAGVQPGRREHRRPARRRAHPAADHLRGGEDDHEPRRSCDRARSTTWRWCSGPTSASPPCSC